LKTYFDIGWAPDARNPWKIDKNQRFLKTYYDIGWAPDAGNQLKID